MALMPPNATGHETYDDLNHAFAGPQHVQNRVVRSLWSVPNVSGVDTSTANDLMSQGAGTDDLVEINSSEICGFSFDADDASYGHLWLYPEEVDLSGDIDFRAVWCESGTTTTNSCKFIVVYTPLAEGTAVAVGSTALDTVIADDLANGTSYGLQFSPWGTIDGNTISSTTYAPGEAALAIKTYVDVSSVTALTLNLQARYYRRYID